MKINLKEFRIGNHFKPTDGSNLQFKEVEIDDLIAWERGAIYGKPILLNESILFDLGFKKMDPGGFFTYQTQKSSLIFILYFHDVLWRFGYNKLQSHCFSHFKYVHQLQNLVFNLTEEELIF